MLRQYLRLEKLIINAESALKSLEDAQGRVEVKITRLLEDGATVEPGKCNALIDVHFGARRPPWKDIYLTHMSVVHGDNRDVIEAEKVISCEPSLKQAIIVTKT